MRHVHTNKLLSQMKKLFLIASLLLCICAAAQDTADKSMDKFLSQADTMHVPDSFKDKFDANLITDTSAQHMRNVVFWYTFNQNRKVFQWQYISSILIFFLVMIIVLIGLYLSYLQFKMATKIFTAPPSPDKPDNSAGYVDMMKADLELGKDGIKINTAVVGLIILTLSLAFLFLYLKYVYPISIVKTA